MHYAPAVAVLAETIFSGEHHPWRTNVVIPVTFMTNYHAGRVFYTSLGHTSDELDLPDMRPVLRRGLLWAVRLRGIAGQVATRHQAKPSLRVRYPVAPFLQQ